MFNLYLSRKEHDQVLKNDASILVHAFQEATSTRWSLGGVELTGLEQSTIEKIRIATGELQCVSHDQKSLTR